MPRLKNRSPAAHVRFITGPADCQLSYPAPCGEARRGQDDGPRGPRNHPMAGKGMIMEILLGWGLLILVIVGIGMLIRIAGPAGEARPGCGGNHGTATGPPGRCH